MGLLQTGTSCVSRGQNVFLAWGKGSRAVTTGWGAEVKPGLGLETGAGLRVMLGWGVLAPGAGGSWAGDLCYGRAPDMCRQAACGLVFGGRPSFNAKVLLFYAARMSLRPIRAVVGVRISSHSIMWLGHRLLIHRLSADTCFTFGY